jgi:Na+-translocating ferredoxin:NAD+ oxidoreductase subunit B
VKHVAAIDAWLPQTQCTRCGYDDCLAYAEAIADQGEHMDRCPPGGEATLNGLAKLLGLTPPPGIASELEPFDGFRVAHIIEAECIGCTKCIDACPVDAIVGSSRSMHTVLASLCTGCELCIPPCPVDCIRLEASQEQSPRSPLWPTFPQDAAGRFRYARDRRRRRLDSAGRTKGNPAPGPAAPDDDAMRREILEAVERRRTRRRHWQKPGSASWTKRP